jgi:tetratricopeptide (TPR) repeat protein
MKKYYCLLVTLLLLITAGKSQDSLVRLSEIRFSSDFEKKAFHKFFQDKNADATIELLLSPAPGGPAQILVANSRLEEIIKKLEPAVLEAKKPEKRIKIITDQVKATFLKHYNPIIGFGELLSTGMYNSVNATALYTLVFDRLKIPYGIQETPTHVFLVAYPDQQKIAVETITPTFTYRIFDSKYQDAFVDDLKNANLIGDAESSAFTTEGLFMRHFFANRNLSQEELIGLHYLNDAYQKNDNNDYAGAFRQCEKSYLFFPSERCGFVMTNLAIQTLVNQKISPRERALYIAKLSRFENFGITAEIIQGEFMKINEEVLVRDNNRPLFNECADIIVNNGLQEEAIRNAIRYVQYYELGRADYNQGRYTMAKFSFAKALQLQPSNAEMGATFLGALAFSMRNINDASVLDTVLVYKKRLPTLMQNNNFKSLLANAYLVASADVMNSNNLKQAEALIAEFEKLYDEDKTERALVVGPNQAGEAYSKLCTYYFKRGQKEKAKAILKRGLEIAPDSYELRIRQQMIN